MGPTTKAITVTGGVTFPELLENFYEQAKGLVEGGADILLLETCQDTRNIKAGLLAIQRLGSELGLPHSRRWSPAPSSRWAPCSPARPPTPSTPRSRTPICSPIGLNCATGPEFMTDHIRTLHEMATTRVSCYPNAGLPNEEGKYLETPDTLAAQLERFVDHGWLNIVGGCCGTTPAHIQRHRADGRRQDAARSRSNPSHRAYFSGIELVEAEESNRPLIVGERTNVIGSRLFKNMIAEEKWEEATEIARWQVKNGAHIIDVCLQSTRPRRDAGHPAVLREADPQDQSADHDRHHRSARRSNWRSPTARARASSIRSTWKTAKRSSSASARSRSATARRWWSAPSTKIKLQAQAFTRERKLAVAAALGRAADREVRHRARRHHHRSAGVPVRHRRRELHRRRGRNHRRHPLIKEKIPYVKTVLGISNISFGLPAAAREVVNSVFLYYCTKAGLDLAIVNAEKLERFASHSRRRAAPGREPAVQHAAGGRARGSPNAAARSRSRGLARSRSRNRRPPSISSTSRPSPNISAETGKRQKQKAADLPLDRAPRQLHHRRHQGRPDRRSRPASAPKARRRSTSSTAR